MIIERAEAADMEEILSIQKMAYISEAEIYDDYSIPPKIFNFWGSKIQNEFW